MAMITIKDAGQIEKMARTGRLAASIVAKMSAEVQPGITTIELDEIARKELLAAGARAYCKDFGRTERRPGFPGHTCISVNEEVLHGVPGQRQLLEGDIVTLDVGPVLDGFYASVAVTVGVGKIDPLAAQLINRTNKILAEAIRRANRGVRWSAIARMIQDSAQRYGYNVVREFVGHGIGTRMHEDPKVPNFVDQNTPRSDFVLKAGMTFTIEPAILSGGRSVEMLENGWTVAAQDGLAAAHARHTIAVRESGAQILTLAS